MTKFYTLSVFLLYFTFSFSQERIAVAQSSRDVVILLDPNDGSLIDNDFIDLTAFGAGTPKDILQVSNELWITDQIEDRIDRFDLTGSYISTIDSSVGLDNVRGLASVNGEVWVCNAGTNNGAPGNAIIRFDTAGNLLGNFSTTNSPFDVVDTGTEAIIGFINTDSIERFDYSGNSLSVITTTVDFPQQIQYNETDVSIYVAAFSAPRGVYEFNIPSGNQDYYLDIGVSLRGIIELDNGNLLASGGSGLYTVNTTTNAFTNFNTESSQYLSRVNLTPLSVEEDTLLSFSIHPNPATDDLNLTANINFTNIRISNLLGQNVFELNTDSKTERIDISNLKAGVYMLSVQNENRSVVKKFVKK
ncbi:T9SS type A sorting domain-containing protein [Winogradskyella luteola]|uniref:T9SS type A sorting domain-containing protein n=1 Tax=Winogradskyella luteola TaxID=2828330 RepID=A0A9X1F5V4_9FLAO|nr:T9SS type A sorting domain-containing protein [Winogradskyella luteola]MBV7267957.1 T9SS type A sorting domain-containing protein [Winogradskyella luteola]